MHARRDGGIDCEFATDPLRIDMHIVDFIARGT
jgi:hypothetical protein